MVNKESLQRSDVLTSHAQPFFNYKTKYFEKNQNASAKQYMKFFHATNDDWNNWAWQLQNRVVNTEQLKKIFNLTQYEYDEIENVRKQFRFAITPYYLSLIREFNVNDPIYLQCIPQSKELCKNGKYDPMNESNNNPAGAITRRYPDRLIINVTNNCATFCRHCQRRRNIGESDTYIDDACLEESYRYIKKHPEIRDVLVTGGDPLTLYIPIHETHLHGHLEPL